MGQQQFSEGLSHDWIFTLSQTKSELITDSPIRITRHPTQTIHELEARRRAERRFTQADSMAADCRVRIDQLTQSMVVRQFFQRIENTDRLKTRRGIEILAETQLIGLYPSRECAAAGDSFQCLHCFRIVSPHEFEMNQIATRPVMRFQLVSQR